ncbi:MAG: TonB-dependent receptor [Sandaracinaceae bacterium]|nr:TonB-dependent receptor [Sandaracinaceae bacterium]
MTPARACLLLGLGLVTSAARAQEPPDDAELGVEARVRAPDDPTADRARTTVSREELEESLPRSAPDALRSVPGVTIQQTSHGQASPYVRGLTGQRVVHLFDGVRLNTGIYRQGPNQYFFTVDSATLERLEVVRGSASTVWGPDALGGAILAIPRERRPNASLDGVYFEPALTARFRSADLEWGGRAELGADLGDRVSFLGGVGFRFASRLRSGGVVGSPVEGTRALVPRFTEEVEGRPADEWHTQLGTGFSEMTFDGRLVYQLAPRLRLLGAVYGYRQTDAPRTDQCPPPEAPADECSTVREQFRTLGYLALRGDAGREVRDLDLILSYQRHHERRDTVRPRSNVRFDYLDDVDTFGFAARAATPAAHLGDASWLRVRYGLDAYRDRVSSAAYQTLTDLDFVLPLSRGQYADGSIYATLGTHLTLEIQPLRGLIVRSGGRLGLVGVRAPGDDASGTRGVRDDFGVGIGRLGAEIRPLRELGVLFSIDQGFRAPNLDDLTSRQQTGPGFQFENPDLRPERSTSFDLGLQVRLPWLTLDAHAFALVIEDGIVRAIRGAADCPPGTPACQASRVHLQLVNARGLATLFGAEGGATARLPEDLTLRATVAYAWGEGPDPNGDERVPLSRVPPVNGTVEARWRHTETGIYLGAVFRWAATQDRLAPSDVADARIPIGGTPGWATLDLRGGWRLDEYVLLGLVVENLFDVAYRVHGSSINAPGIGVLASATVRLWPL